MSRVDANRIQTMLTTLGSNLIRRIWSRGILWFFNLFSSSYLLYVYLWPTNENGLYDKSGSVRWEKKWFVCLNPIHCHCCCFLFPSAGGQVPTLPSKDRRGIKAQQKRTGGNKGKDGERIRKTKRETQDKKKEKEKPNP